MRLTGIAYALLGTTLLCGSASLGEARTLSDQISSLFGEGGIELTPEQISGIPHRTHFTSESLATLGLLVKQLAPNAADFPAISTVPGFTYRYNSQLQVFERSSASLGPVFVERPQTLGRGKFDLGFSYMFVDFDELNGTEMGQLQFTDLQHNDCCPPGRVPSAGVPPFEIDTADLFFERFNLQSHVVSYFATYGLTERWDVNVLIPIVFTSFDLRARAVLNNESASNTHFFDPLSGRREEVRSVADDKTGVGDLLLRSKYHLLEAHGFNLALGSALRVPTGEEDDFQGIGDTTLTPFVALAQEYGWLDVHASGGMEINFDDSDRSRVRFAGGVTLQVVEQLALMADVVGSSNVTTDRIAVAVPQFVNAPGSEVAVPVSRSVTRTLSNEILDLAVGFKANVVGSVVGFATVFVPLNDDGLRAEVIPAAGLEVSF
jgi:hypothetical protein